MYLKDGVLEGSRLDFGGPRLDFEAPRLDLGGFWSIISKFLAKIPRKPRTPRTPAKTRPRSRMHQEWVGDGAPEAVRIAVAAGAGRSTVFHGAYAAQLQLVRTLRPAHHARALPPVLGALQSRHPPLAARLPARAAAVRADGEPPARRLGSQHSSLARAPGSARRADPEDRGPRDGGARG